MDAAGMAGADLAASTMDDESAGDCLIPGTDAPTMTITALG